MVSEVKRPLLWKGLEGNGHLILKGIWNLLVRNKYSGQVTSTNKINILSCHETKRNTAYIDDLIINEQTHFKFNRRFPD
jgi:hypothetical protein